MNSTTNPLQWELIHDDPAAPMARAGEWFIIPSNGAYGVWRGEEADEPCASFNTLPEAKQFCELQGLENLLCTTN